MDQELIANRTANVRLEPDVDSRRLGSLGVGARIQVTGKVAGRDWYRIKFEGGPAYVFAPLLSAAPGRLANRPGHSLRRPACPSAAFAGCG